MNIGVQGAAGRFDGVPVADLAAAKRGLAREIVAGILDTYADADAAYAWHCLERNGGVDALRFADYDADFGGFSRRAGDAPSQIFRLEGPAAVFHFRGEPHVHAFLNVAMDGERPLSLGDVVGENPARARRRRLARVLRDGDACAARRPTSRTTRRAASRGGCARGPSGPATSGSPRAG